MTIRHHRSKGVAKRLQILLMIGYSVTWAPRFAMGLPGAQDAKPTAQAAEVLEEGRFRLHKFEQPIGEEAYQITADADTIAAKIEFKFTDRGTEVPLSVAFRAALDLTPKSFAIKGKTSRQSSIDEDVEVFPNQVRVRDRDHSTEFAAPQQF